MKITSKVIPRRIENAVISSCILPHNIFAYYKEHSGQDLIRHLIDVINDAAGRQDNPDHVCCFLSYHFTSTFDVITKEYLYNLLRLLGFLERTITMITNLYSQAICHILLNECKVKQFLVYVGSHKDVLYLERSNLTLGCNLS